MLLASTALHKKGGLWDPLVKGCVEQWPDLADPIGCETSPKSDCEEGGGRLQLLGLLDCVYRHGGKDPEKVVIADSSRDMIERNKTIWQKWVDSGRGAGIDLSFHLFDCNSPEEDLNLQDSSFDGMTCKHVAFHNGAWIQLF